MTNEKFDLNHSECAQIAQFAFKIATDYQAHHDNPEARRSARVQAGVKANRWRAIARQFSLGGVQMTNKPVK